MYQARSHVGLELEQDVFLAKWRTAAARNMGLALNIDIL